MTDVTERNRWIATMLGVDLTNRPSPMQGSHEKLGPIWAEAAGKAIGELERLQAAIRALRTPLAAVLAKKGIGGLIKQIRGGLPAALDALDRAAGDDRQKAIAEVRGQIGTMRALINQHPALPMLESNAFGVAVDIRGALSAALGRLEKALTG